MGEKGCKVQPEPRALQASTAQCTGAPVMLVFQVFEASEHLGKLAKVALSMNCWSFLWGSF